MRQRVEHVLEKLADKQITNGMYYAVCSHQDEFLRMGITLSDLKRLLELKSRLAFLPDSLSYSLGRPGRGEHILENFDLSPVEPMDDAERRFMVALHTYYQQEVEFKQKMDKLSSIAKECLKPLYENLNYQLGERQEIKLLIDTLVGFDIDSYPYKNIGVQQRFLRKFDLYDAYHIDDGRMTLRWKAGEVLESKGLLDKGWTERVMCEAGVLVDKLKDGLYQHKIDGLRISDVEVITSKNGVNKSIGCRVDGEHQISRELAVSDTALLDRLDNKIGMAVKYYADILDSNRKANRMIADEKSLARMSMPHIDRLIDICKHGMNEQDMMLSKVSAGLDSFWYNIEVSGMHNYSVDIQKKYAFRSLSNYIGNLEPGQVTDEMIIDIVGIKPIFVSPGREIERNLLNLPESFFPLIEQSGKFDRTAIDYVKVLRGINRITPEIANNSMSYFLSNRSYAVWEPLDVDNDSGQITGHYDFPNKNMSNPAEKFPPNLLSEPQWNALINKYPNDSAEFIPTTAFRKNRITGVQVYPLGNGELNIRCMVDGVQQGGKILSETDATRYRDEKTGLKELALGYFQDAFAKEELRNVSLER